MKTRFIFLFLFIICFSCTTNNKPVSDVQNEKIKGEVEVLFEDISNPDKTKNKWIFEFISPDLLTWKDVVDNKVTNTYTFHRKK